MTLKAAHRHTLLLRIDLVARCTPREKTLYQLPATVDWNLAAMTEATVHRFPFCFVASMLW